MRASEASTICPGIVLVHVETISEGVEVSTFTDGDGIRLWGHVLATGCGYCNGQRALNSEAKQKDRRSLQLDCALGQIDEHKRPVFADTARCLGSVRGNPVTDCQPTTRRSLRPGLGRSPGGGAKVFSKAGATLFAAVILALTLTTKYDQQISKNQALAVAFCRPVKGRDATKILWQRRCEMASIDEAYLDFTEEAFEPRPPGPWGPRT